MSVEESRRLQTEPIDLDTCLKAFTKEEELGEDELYYCSKCKEHRLAAKKLDMIVANDISAADAGFGVDTNRISLLFPGGKQETLPLMNKAQAAEVIIARLVDLLETG